MKIPLSKKQAAEMVEFPRQDVGEASQELAVYISEYSQLFPQIAHKILAQSTKLEPGEQKEYLEELKAAIENSLVELGKISVRTSELGEELDDEGESEDASENASVFNLFTGDE